MPVDLGVSARPARRRLAADRRRRSRPRGFTILEMVVAGTVAIIVVGAISISLNQLGRSRASTMKRLDAHMRANAALDALRRDVASLLRSDDLFNSRVLITDDSTITPAGSMDRDEILLFNSRFNAIRPDKYQGEGSDYETQYRVSDDDMGAALWQRRDPAPDRWPDAGGLATPVVDGVIGLNLEAYDGESWYPDWDSDIYGLPWAVRATVTAIGTPTGEEAWEDTKSIVQLRTTIAIDRIVPPKEEEMSSDKAEQAAEDAAAAEEAGVGGGGVAIPVDGRPPDGQGPGGDGRPGGGPGTGAGGGPGPGVGTGGGGSMGGGRGGRGGNGGFIGRGGRGNGGGPRPSGGGGGGGGPRRGGAT